MLRRRRAGHPTAERTKQVLGAGIDGRSKLEFHGFKVTSDAGLLAYRELDETPELTATGAGTAPK